MDTCDRRPIQTWLVCDTSQRTDQSRSCNVQVHSRWADRGSDLDHVVEAIGTTYIGSIAIAFISTSSLLDGASVPFPSCDCFGYVKLS